jgi:hypothetical protein
VRVLCAIGLACGLAASPAAASDDKADAESRMAARVLAAQGSEAFEQREFARALELFERASAIVQAPTISLMEARTLVELGRLVEAARRYASTQRMLAVDPSNTIFRDAADAAQRELEPLMRRLPTLRVRLVGVGRGEKPEIRIDGRKLPPDQAAVDRPLDPGRHRIEVRLSSGVTVREVILLERQHEDVVIMPALPEARPAPEAAATRPSAATGEPSAPRTLGWAVAGAGLAFTSFGAVTGALALDRKSSLDAACDPGCPPGSADDISAFRRNRTLSYVGFGVGAVGLLAGGYLLLRPLTPSRLALRVEPNAVSLVGKLP